MNDFEVHPIGTGKLIERLRKANAMKNGDTFEFATCDEAADALESAQWKLELEVSECKKKLEAKGAEIARLKELTENDAIEIGSYRDVTGLRGENMKLMEALADLAEENEKLQRVVDSIGCESCHAQALAALEEE